MDKKEIRNKYKNGLDFLEDSLKNSKRYTKQIKNELTNKDVLVEELYNMSVIFKSLYDIIVNNDYDDNKKIEKMIEIEIDGEQVMNEKEAEYLLDLVMFRLNKNEINEMKKYINEKYADIINPRKYKKQYGGQTEADLDKFPYKEAQPPTEAPPPYEDESYEQNLEIPVQEKTFKEGEKTVKEGENTLEEKEQEKEQEVDTESEGEKKVYPVSSTNFEKTESMSNSSLTKSKVPTMLLNAVNKIFPKPEKEIYDSNNKPLELTDDVKNYCLLNISSLIPKLIIGAPKYIFNFLSDIAHGVASFFNFSFDNFEDFSKPLDFTFYLLFALASIPTVGALFDIIIILRALSHRRLFLAIITGLTFIASLILTGHIFDLGALLKLFYALEVNNSVQTENYVDNVAKNNLQIIANETD